MGACDGQDHVARQAALGYGKAQVDLEQLVVLVAQAGLGYEDNELFKIYLRLPVPKRRLARDVILAIARAHEAEEAERAAGS